MRLKVGAITIAALFLAFGTSVLRVHFSRAHADETFGNMTYLTNDGPYSLDHVTLANGRYEWRYESEDGVFLSYDLQYAGRFIGGDFNRDGLKDAVVILVENSGGNAECYILTFLINDGRGLVHRKSAYLGDRVRIGSLSEKDGRVIVDLFVHHEDDCMAGPTKHVKDVFEYSGSGRWVEGKQISAKSFLDPVILMVKHGYGFTYLFERREAFLEERPSTVSSTRTPLIWLEEERSRSLIREISRSRAATSK